MLGALTDCKINSAVLQKSYSIWYEIMTDNFYLTGFSSDVKSRADASNTTACDIDTFQVWIAIAVFQRDFKSLILSVLIFTHFYNL